MSQVHTFAMLLLLSMRHGWNKNIMPWSASSPDLLCTCFFCIKCLLCNVNFTHLQHLLLLMWSWLLPVTTVAGTHVTPCCGHSSGPRETECCFCSDCIWHYIHCMQQVHGFTAVVELYLLLVDTCRHVATLMFEVLTVRWQWVHYFLLCLVWVCFHKFYW
jgi:hypothetical protein